MSVIILLRTPIVCANSNLFSELIGNLELKCSDNVKREYIGVLNYYAQETDLLNDLPKRDYFVQSVQAYMSGLISTSPRMHDERDTPYIDAYYRVKLFDLKRTIDNFGRSGVPTPEEQNAMKKQVERIVTTYRECFNQYFPSFRKPFIDTTMEQVEGFYGRSLGNGFEIGWSKPLRESAIKDILTAINNRMRDKRGEYDKDSMSGHIQNIEVQVAQYMWENVVFSLEGKIRRDTIKNISAPTKVYTDGNEYVGVDEAVTLMHDLSTQADARHYERIEREDELIRKRDAEDMRSDIVLGDVNQEDIVREAVNDQWDHLPSQSATESSDVEPLAAKLPTVAPTGEDTVTVGIIPGPLKASGSQRILRGMFYIAMLFMVLTFIGTGVFLWRKRKPH